MTASSSRRQFLKTAAAFGAVGASPFAMQLAGIGGAASAAGSGYKALVCVFMNGGNDAFDMLLPTDAQSWAAYQAARNIAPESIAQLPAGTPASPAAARGTLAALGGVLPISPTRPQGRSFALHPCLPHTTKLFKLKKLAFVTNVGPLISPTTKSDYSNPRFHLPAKLFSHNDQQSTWQSFSAEGASAGWGGRFADAVASANGNNSTFTAISASGAAVFLAGQTTSPYMVGTSGPIKIGTSGTTLFGSSKALADMQAALTNSRHQSVFAADAAKIYAESISAQTQIGASMPPATVAPFGTSASPDPTLRYANPATGSTVNSNLAAQLQVVARLISAGQSQGLSRQVFYVSYSGFDTHDNEDSVHADLYSRLDHSLTYFDSMMASLGLSDSVTLFTMSDFGRTFLSNGDGTDHGWGSHHIVSGGAVKGGDLYGTFPQYGMADGKGGWSSPDQIQSGIMIPTTSVDQYAATLGAWFGVPQNSLSAICPNLGNFSVKNLGFV